MEGSFVYWDDPRRSTSSGRRSPAPRPSIPSHRKLRRNIPIAGYPGARGGCAARPSRRDRSGSVPRSVRFRAEIGSVPCRDRSGSAPRSVRRRRARLPGPRVGHSCTSPTAASSDSSRNVELDGTTRHAGEDRPPAGIGPASDRAPRAGPARIGLAVVGSPARSYPDARGRTLRRAVVPEPARSYVRSAPKYDRE